MFCVITSMEQEQRNAAWKERKIVIPVIKEDSWDRSIEYRPYFLGKPIFDFLSDDRTEKGVSANISISYKAGGECGWAAPDYASGNIHIGLYSAPSKKIQEGRDRLQDLLYSNESFESTDIINKFFQENPYLKEEFSEQLDFQARRMPKGFIFTMIGGKKSHGNFVKQERVAEGRNWLEGITKLSRICLDTTQEMLYTLGVKEEDIEKARRKFAKVLYDKGRVEPSFYSKHPILTKELELILKGDDPDVNINEKYQARYYEFAQQITQLNGRINSLVSKNDDLVRENSVLKNPSYKTLLKKMFKLW